LGTTSFPRIDQCTLDQQRQVLACAGGGGVWWYSIPKSGAPQQIGMVKINKGVHTVGIDEQTSRAWAVWGASEGDFIQGFTYTF
jgi:hypothetical protein